MGSGDDPQLKTSSVIHADLAPLDISGNLAKDQRGMSKGDRNKHVFALNKKLIKPLTGNKANG